MYYLRNNGIEHAWNTVDCVISVHYVTTEGEVIRGHLPVVLLIERLQRQLTQLPQPSVKRLADKLVEYVRTLLYHVIWEKRPLKLYSFIILGYQDRQP